MVSCGLLDIQTEHRYSSKEAAGTAGDHPGTGPRSQGRQGSHTFPDIQGSARVRTPSRSYPLDPAAQSGMWWGVEGPLGWL